MQDSAAYRSGRVHETLQATHYAQTHRLPHRFLAYRDFPSLIGNFRGVKKALDLGSGTGASTSYLIEQGYETLGVDKSPAMVQVASENFPDICFLEIDQLKLLPKFDLVFSSFVLFELASKSEILGYLNTASAVLREGGVFVGITGSECLHQKKRDWMCFNVDYQENLQPCSGDVVKLGLRDPEIEFYDYYWTEADYKECFGASDFDLIRIHYPLGLKEEPFEWKEELLFSPFVIFLARKKN